jgi:hypothetical protein
MLSIPILTLVGVACAHGAFTCPATGGDTWRSISSEHFEIATDVPPQDATAILSEDERVFGAFEDLLFPYEPKLRDRIRIILFRSTSEFDRVAPHTAAGFFFYGKAENESKIPTIVLSLQQVRLRDPADEILRHELTHAFVRHFYPHAPVWLNEGLATYYSTLALDGDDALIGRPLSRVQFSDGDYLCAPSEASSDRICLIPRSRVPMIAELISLDPASFYVGMKTDPASWIQRASNYAGAWALIHFLENGDTAYKARFEDVRDALTQGTGWPDAWTGSFSGLAPDQPERDFRVYLTQRAFGVWKVHYKGRPQPPPPAVRELEDAELHALWATIGIRQDARNPHRSVVPGFAR